MIRRLPLSTKNDAMPHTRYTAANTNNLVGEDGRRPTWPSGPLASGRSNGPIRAGRRDGRLAPGSARDAPAFGVTRPPFRRFLGFATSTTVPE